MYIIYIYIYIYICVLICVLICTFICVLICRYQGLGFTHLGHAELGSGPLGNKVIPTRSRANAYGKIFLHGQNFVLSVLRVVRVVLGNKAIPTRSRANAFGQIFLHGQFFCAFCPQGCVSGPWE